MTGWIKLHRKIKDSDLYPKSREFTKYEAWLDLLMIANRNDKNVMVGNDVVVCKRGQSIRSVESYQKLWNWNRQQVRSFFDLLVRMEMVTKETTSKTTIITICNYEIYQGEQPTDNQQNEDAVNNQQNNQQITIKTTMLKGYKTGVCNDEQPTNNQQNNQQTIHKQEVKKKEEKERVKFTPPSLPEIQSYFSLKIQEKRLQLDPINEAEKFEAHYGAKNWMIGKNKMTDWKKAVSGWIARSGDMPIMKQQPQTTKPNNVVTQW